MLHFNNSSLLEDAAHPSLPHFSSPSPFSVSPPHWFLQLILLSLPFPLPLPSPAIRSSWSKSSASPVSYTSHLIAGVLGSRVLSAATRNADGLLLPFCPSLWPSTAGLGCRGCRPGGSWIAFPSLPWDTSCCLAGQGLPPTREPGLLGLRGPFPPPTHLPPCTHWSAALEHPAMHP